jgi:hypothetical protein
MPFERLTESEGAIIARSERYVESWPDAMAWWDALEESERDSVVVLRHGPQGALRRWRRLDYSALGPGGCYYVNRLFQEHVDGEGRIRP